MPVSGLNNLEFQLLNASILAGHRIGRVIRKAGEDVIRDAQAMCPVDTGNLRSSICAIYETEEGLTAYDGMAWKIGPTASYGKFVELGTSRMAPHAFLGPAFDRNVPPTVAAMQRLGVSLLAGVPGE